MTFNATDVNVTCCNLDGTPKSVTCGRGLSCAASCFSLEANLCPSHNCEACDTFEEERPQARGWSYVTQASDALAFCPGPGTWCNVHRVKGCCFHPVCRKEKEGQCWKTLKYHTGRSSFEKKNTHSFSGKHCPRPDRIRNGRWTCEKQQIPIPEAADLGGDLQTYRGK